jgi:hypothetical protein
MTVSDDAARAIATGKMDAFDIDPTADHASRGAPVGLDISPCRRIVHGHLVF